MFSLDPFFGTNLSLFFLGNLRCFPVGINSGNDGCVLHIVGPTLEVVFVPPSVVVFDKVELLLVVVLGKVVTTLVLVFGRVVLLFVVVLDAVRIR